MNPVDQTHETRRHQACIPRCPEREWMNTAELTCEEFGFLQRLRDFSMARGGIEDSENLLQRLAKSFQLSKYKLKKLWPVLENFFTLRDGFFIYEPDEQQRAQVININTKRRVAGSLGAKVRWSKRLEEFPEDPATADGNAIGQLNGMTIALAANIESVEQQQLLLKIEKPAAAIESTGVIDAASVEKSSPAGPEKKLRVIARCRTLELQIPDLALCARLIQRFPQIEPECWPKFTAQISPGLWLSKSPDDMINEIDRQREQERKGPQSATGKKHQSLAANGKPKRDPYFLGD